MSKQHSNGAGSSTPLSYDSDTPLDRTPTERDSLLNKQRSIDNALQSEFVAGHGTYGSDGGDSNDRRDAGKLGYWAGKDAGSGGERVC